jgi:uncharacterized DUF497 family protein
MAVEFDPAKRDKTLLERGLDFARAGEMFAGRVYTARDDRKDYPEPRFISMGRLDGRMIVIVWTPISRGRRIISMRKANEREQAKYGALV